MQLLLVLCEGLYVVSLSIHIFLSSLWCVRLNIPPVYVSVFQNVSVIMCPVKAHSEFKHRDCVL